MRNRYAVPQAGRAEAFARKQAVGHDGAAEVVQLLKQQAGFFKGPFFAGGLNINKNLRGRQYGSKTIHRVNTNTECELWAKTGGRPRKNPNSHQTPGF